MTEDYLWDRAGAPDPEVARLERLLGALAHDNSHALTLPPVRRISRAYVAVALGTAAAVGILTLVTFRYLPTPTGFVVERVTGVPTLASRPIGRQEPLPVGAWLETDPIASAEIDLAGVGRVEVGPNSRLSLIATRPGDHRLDLERGSVQAVIWAPPGQVSVKTPTSTAVDLGCIYTMTVQADGTGVVEVAAGWVGFEWQGRESFIPAGAVCVTRPGLGPGTPHYADTSDEFQASLAVIDLGDVSSRPAALDRVLAAARARDALTLWHLLTRVELGDRERVFDRLSEFVPPPGNVTRLGIRDGNRQMLDDWWTALDLGTAAWWDIWKRQWRDTIPAK